MTATTTPAKKPASSSARSKPASDVSDEEKTPVRFVPATVLRGLLNRPLASFYLLVGSAALLLAIGLVMVLSASSIDSIVKNGSAWNTGTVSAA